MRDFLSTRVVLAIAIVGLTFSGTVRAETPALPPPEDRESIDAIKPLPVAPIPDDPPPHEGAMIDIPYIIAPPDLLLVEALEALPGRPISGERLVRPDGTISLGFYGEVHVRGLTMRQAKEKIVRHLRAYLDDEVLGLLRVELPPLDAKPAEDVPPAENGKKSSRRPVGPREPVAKSVRREGRSSRVFRRTSQPGGNPRKPLTAPPAESSEAPYTISADQPPGIHLEVPGSGGVTITIEIKGAANATMPRMEPEPAEVDTMPPDVKVHPVHPADTDRVFVDVTAFNSKNYYVQGDVAAPGKLPWTGHETVLDAMNHAGGLIPSAEPKNIRLIRPARGGKPARIYPVDLEAITERGEIERNYQLFPGDRLVVGRNPVVKTSILIDRLAAPMQTVFHSILQQSNAIRSLLQAATNGNTTLTPEQRDALVKETADFWSKILSRPEGIPLDEKTIRDGLLRALQPPASEKPAESK